MPKVKCINGECKFNDHDGKCTKKSIKIDYNGCMSFEKNIIYYIHLVWDELDKTNMIFPFKLTPDLRIGLFYVMELYGLKFKSNTWGNDSFITLHKDGVKDGTALGYKDIISIDMDMGKLKYHMEKFNQGILPPYDEDKKESKEMKSEPKVESQPYGWLSPTGEFTESDWGTHEDAAQEIVNKKGFEEEYRKWNKYQEEKYKDVNSKRIALHRDFLVEVKGYVIIHNPCLIGNYIVTYVKDLTKKQKDFLYGYFIDMGDRLTAETYLED